MYNIQYEWDDDKNFSNFIKHGISFEKVEFADWENAYIIQDLRFEYMEERFIAYVPIDKRIHAVIYTKRNEFRRIISLRKANAREIEYYEKNRRN